MPAAPAQILFVEASKLYHRMVGLALNSVGHVQCEATLAGAWETIQTKGPFNLVVSDLGFPEGEAWPLLFMIRRIAAPLKLPIVMLTNSWDRITLAKFYQVGVNLVIRKPPQPPELQRQIAQMLAAPWVATPDDLLGDAQTITWSTPTKAVAYCPNLDFREEDLTPAVALKKLQTRIQAHATTNGTIPLVAGISTADFIPKTGA